MREKKCVSGEGVLVGRDWSIKVGRDWSVRVGRKWLVRVGGGVSEWGEI